MSTYKVKVWPYETYISNMAARVSFDMVEGECDNVSQQKVAVMNTPLNCVLECIVKSERNGANL